MKVIALHLEDWQADVLAAASAREEVTPEELIRRMAVCRANREVDSVSRKLIESAPTVAIELLLVELFSR